MIFIYLHGFNSAYDPSAEKIQILSELGEVKGITYNTFGTYQEIFNEISSQVPNVDDIVFVGTSLGGFWAAEMGRKFMTPSVIINPCYNPRNMLSKYVGVKFTNYQNGKVDTLVDEAVKTYPTSMTGEDTSFNFLPLVLLDMEDEVINSFETRKVLAGFPMIHWAGGSHRFDHMSDAIQEINSYTNHCSYANRGE